jgi:DNA repair exonuclease SbcCD ATPase subunit
VLHLTPTLLALLVGGRSWSAGPGRGTTPSTASTPTFTGRGQYEALDALVEALRLPDQWLAYRAEALLDLPPEQGAQAAGGAPAVERVRTALVERDDVLRRAREDLEGARSIAATWEAEVVTARAALEETEGLKTAQADKAAALTTAEEQLRQERAARQEAKDQLQQERAALVEGRAALERERMAWEEVLGQLQQECAVLEGAQAMLKQQENEVSRLNEELLQIRISHEDLRQAQEATVLNLQRQAQEARQSLEGEKKQVEGEFFLGFAPNFVSLCLWLSGLRTAMGNMTTQTEVVQMAYNSSQQELEALQAAARETCQGIEEGEAQAGRSLRAACEPSGGTSASGCAVPSTLVLGRPSVWWGRITRWTSRPCLPATSSR